MTKMADIHLLSDFEETKEKEGGECGGRDSDVFKGVVDLELSHKKRELGLLL
jgi:hypothetical protein